jgi:hypothetical protein
MTKSPSGTALGDVPRVWQHRAPVRSLDCCDPDLLLYELVGWALIGGRREGE